MNPLVFVRWLRDLGTAVCGTAGDPSDCPLARFLKHEGITATVTFKHVQTPDHVFDTPNWMHAVLRYTDSLVSVDDAPEEVSRTGLPVYADDLLRALHTPVMVDQPAASQDTPIYASLVVTPAGAVAHTENAPLFSVVTPGPRFGETATLANLGLQTRIDLSHVVQVPGSPTRYETWAYAHAHVEPLAAIGATRSAYASWLAALPDEVFADPFDPDQTPFVVFLQDLGFEAHCRAGTLVIDGQPWPLPAWVAVSELLLREREAYTATPSDVLSALGPIFTDPDQIELHHIVRVEQYDENDHVKAVGWNVRIRRDGKITSKFFSDGKHGGTAQALAEAVEYRNHLVENAKPVLRRTRSDLPGLITRWRALENNTPYLLVDWRDEVGERHVRYLSIAEHSFSSATSEIAELLWELHGGRPYFNYNNPSEVLGAVRKKTTDTLFEGSIPECYQ